MLSQLSAAVSDSLGETEFLPFEDISCKLNDSPDAIVF